MTAHPLVTVIAVCYNHARFVIECLDSIRDQTYPHVQIIIMDDFSRDNSVEIIQNWIERHGIKCRFIAHQQNLGLCRTLNEALELAQGKYISMIATDDMWMPEKLAYQVRLMENLPEEVGVLYGDAYQIDESGRQLNRMFIEAHRSFNTMPEGDIFPILLDSNFIPAMSTLIRTATYAKVGKYDERLVYEDWDMWLRISRYFKFAYSPNITTQYRIVPSSLTRKTLWARDSARFTSDFLIAEKLLAVQGLTKQQQLMLRKRLADYAYDLYNIGYADARSYLWKALKISADMQTIMTFLLTICRIPHSSLRSWPSYLKWRWSGVKAWLSRADHLWAAPNKVSDSISIAVSIVPKVSICIPTYNGARYLEACLDSVLSQTYKDIEILAVDDWSTDATLEILERYAAGDQRIRLVRNEHNLGLVGNWNRCVELAHGEWIKFVFQDDLLREDCLEKMLAVAARPVVFCRRDFLFEAGTDEETIQAYNRIPCIPEVLGNLTDVESVRIQDAVLREPSNFFGEPTAALLHRSLFERFGMFNADLAQFCDLEYWIRVAINTGLSYVDEPLVTFRYHASSMSASNRDPLREEQVSIFDRLIIGHEFAYNPHYTSLRWQARGISPKRNFQRELAEKAVWVHARALANRHESPDQTWIKRWNKLVKRYPRLARSSWHLPYQVRKLWMRHIGWKL